MQEDRDHDFAKFWAYYLAEHQQPLNRRLHFIGTGAALGFLLLAALLEQPWLILFALFSGYGFAWAGHFFVERNRPATFRAPVKSLLADFRMFYLILNRRTIVRGSKK